MSPPCECHGEPQVWQKHARHSAGGYWFCRVKSAEWGKSTNERLRDLVYAHYGGECACCSS